MGTTTGTRCSSPLRPARTLLGAGPPSSPRDGSTRRRRPLESLLWPRPRDRLLPSSRPPLRLRRAKLRPLLAAIGARAASWPSKELHRAHDEGKPRRREPFHPFANARDLKRTRRGVEKGTHRRKGCCVSYHEMLKMMMMSITRRFTSRQQAGSGPRCKGSQVSQAFY